MACNRPAESPHAPLQAFTDAALAALDAGSVFL